MPPGRQSAIVTFLFTDVVGSTQLTDTLGDEAAQDILRVHNSLVRAEVARHGGSEVKAMGDGFMIAFSTVTSALGCAVGIQRQIARHNQAEPTREFVVRMGLNAGEAIEEEEDFFGAAVIVAARIAALATGGEILASEVVRQLGQGTRGVEFAEKGESQLKGFRESFRLYHVIPSGQLPGEAAAVRRVQFVGRDVEMGRIQDALEQVASGSGLFLLLAGEPGIGKSRLAEEAVRHSRTRGFRVWRGQCRGTEGAPPYLPFVEILRQYIEDRPDDVLLDELGDYATELSKLIPQLAGRLALPAETIPSPPEQERYRLLEAIRHTFGQVARRRPTVLFMEDMQWADVATCLALRHIAASVAEVPILILATGRDQDLGPGHPLADAMAEFSRLQRYARVNLSGLSASAIESMLASVGRGQPPNDLVEAIHEETEGNPFFITELVNHLMAEGRILDADGQWRVDIRREDWDIPHTVRVVIQRRLEGLSDNTRRILTQAAVVGRDFDYDILDAVCGMDAETLLDSMDESIRMGMIEQVEGAAVEFRFAHHVTRQTIYEGLPVLRRQRAHLQVGLAMESIGSAGPEVLAYHFTQAGRMAPPEKARQFLTMAGDKASRMAAWEDAAGYYQRALELIGDANEQESAELLRRLGAAETGKGEWEAAVSCLRRSMEIFERLNDSEAVGWIAYSLRRLYGARGQFAEASEVVDRALSILGASDSEVRCRLLAQAGFIRSAFGEADEAERLLSESLEAAERLGKPAAKGFAAFIRGMHYLNYSQLREAVRWLTEGMQWSLAGNDPWTASQGSSFRRHILFVLGDLAGAGDSIGEEERLARKAGNFLAMCETRWISSSIACLRGDLAGAEDSANQLLAMIESARADSGMPGALINLAYIRFLGGDCQSFEELLARAIGYYDRMSAAPIDDPRPVLLLLRALAGRGEEAQAMLPELQRYFQFEDHWTTSLGEARATLAAALAVMAMTNEASALFGPLKQWTESTGYVLTGASSVPQLMDRVLGMTASAAGDAEAAEHHFERAIQTAGEMGATVELAESRYWYARHLLARPGGSGRQPGRKQLAEARKTWVDAGMTAQAQRADGMEGELPA